ncbi:universal stress protein [Nonomuraea sp. PA05]|uniref:universal stress protein n=1 Tax=Nonomuraea sp. PA05 TaxID=2604466 RepID=UPI0011DABDFD|nr:universal stress protein [Nonomuraea sp. PA05]TYB60174.1 universal stress protein [Nonomuraea sp. PA05]
MTGHIVVGVDASPSATAAVEWAAADARRRELALRIVHVTRHRPGGDEGSAYGAPDAASDEMLSAAAHRARQLAPHVTVISRSRAGNVVEELLAESSSADSLVLGSRGLGGFAGMVLGSVGLAVSRHAERPVVIVRAASPQRHGLVVAGDDRSGHAQAAVAYAVEQARARGARLHLVYAWQVPLFSPYAVAYGSHIEDAMRAEFRQAAERAVSWRERAPELVITDEQVCDHPVAALVKAGRAADLVVVGSRGPGGPGSALPGSVGHGVLHHVTCPVAMVRPPAERPHIVGSRAGEPYVEEGR